MAPKVSVIIPVYKAEKFLETALNSLDNQTFKDFEVIIALDAPEINNTSEYPTSQIGQIIRKFTSKFPIKVSLSTEKGNPAKARNRALRLAEGEYVAFLDSDDWWMKNHLENFVGNADALPDSVGLFYSRSFRGRDDIFGGRECSPRILSYSNPCPWSSVIISRSVLDALKERDGFFFRESLSASDDCDIIYRLRNITKFSFSEQVTVWQR